MTDSRGLVFFGMHGAYSATLLRALIAARLSPSLVVVGVERPPSYRSAYVRMIPAAPTFWQRVLHGHTPGGTPAEASVVDLADVAHGAGIDVILTSDPDVVSVRAAIHAVAPQAFVVGGFPRLLGPRVLELAARGGLNVHPGRLPGERGPAPVFWALKAGRTTLGVTIHMLDAGEDSGDIVAAADVRIEPGIDGIDVHRRAAHTAAPLLVRSLRGLLVGELVRMPQPKVGVGRCPRPTFRDGLVDVSRRAVEVYTFVAGCARHYSLFLESAGDRYFIREALGYEAGATLPSEYVVSGNTLIARCGDGVVELELKPEGAIFSATYTE